MMSVSKNNEKIEKHEKNLELLKKSTAEIKKCKKQLDEKVQLLEYEPQSKKPEELDKQIYNLLRAQNALAMGYIKNFNWDLKEIDEDKKSVEDNISFLQEQKEFMQERIEERKEYYKNKTKDTEKNSWDPDYNEDLIWRKRLNRPRKLNITNSLSEEEKDFISKEKKKIDFLKNARENYAEEKVKEEKNNLQEIERYRKEEERNLSKLNEIRRDYNKSAGKLNGLKAFLEYDNENSLEYTIHSNGGNISLEINALEIDEGTNLEKIRNKMENVIEVPVNYSKAVKYI